MKICFVLDDTIYRPAGVQYFIIHLANFFIQTGHQITILHCPNKLIKEYHLQEGIEVIPVAKVIDLKGIHFNGSVSPLPILGDKKKITSLLASRNFDVIKFNYPYSPFVSHKIVKIANLLKKQGVIQSKLVASLQIHVDSFIPHLGNKVLGWYSKSSLNLISSITHNGTPTKVYSQKYLGRESVYIPVGIENEDIQGKSEGQNEQKKLNLLFLGRLEMRKGVIDLIQALSLLPKDLYNQLEVTIAGNGPLREQAELLAQENGIAINFPGRVSDEEKARLYREADLAVFPASYGEAFGIVLIEAMTYGCAILGYSNVGYADTMGQFAKECLVNPGDITGLAEKIRYSIEHKKRTYELGRELKIFFEEKYDSSVVGKRLLEVYNQ